MPQMPPEQDFHTGLTEHSMANMQQKVNPVKSQAFEGLSNMSSYLPQNQVNEQDHSGLLPQHLLMNPGSQQMAQAGGKKKQKSSRKNNDFFFLMGGHQK
jgi:hypothetical protein